MKQEEGLKLAREVGFLVAVSLDVKTLKVREEVREMCQSNQCHKYASCWSCPPGCGTLQECSQKIRKFQKGILVQTIGLLEDNWDYEGMVKAEERHKKNFLLLKERIWESGKKEKSFSMLSLGSGCCVLCKKCTYPDHPCIRPEQAVSSMEAYGLVISEVCKENQVPYYYGKEKIAYTGCFLFE